MTAHTSAGLPHFVIVGGGTAGWMAACLLAHHWQDKVRVSLVESPDIGIIGVGEGSTPTLRRFFSDLGIAESDWMPQCKATYKANIRFAGWSPASGIDDYSHPFTSQLDTFSEKPFYTNCQTRRLGLDVTTLPDQFLFNGWLAKHNLAPVTPENFPFVIEYGYHFDSGLLGQFLAKHALGLGVNHIQANVSEVLKHPNGDISGLACSDFDNIQGDFFIDCTGFKSMLLQDALGVGFTSFKSNLFNDSAVVFPTGVMDDIPVETHCTALSNGWAWRIPLTHRTGNGYVYSTDFIDKDAAETELRTHLGLLDDPIEARHLQMRVGQAQQHWSHNCLGLGLSQGFIEPLEATALHLVQTSVEIFMDEYARGEFSDRERDSYNRIVTERFERVRDYIVAHYKLNTRNDSEYWQANRDNKHLSQSLLKILDSWFTQKDLAQEIAAQNLQSHFASPSWHCLLAGYGTFPALSPNQPSHLAYNGDKFKEHDLAKFFSGCALNFKSHSEALRF